MIPFTRDPQASRLKTERSLKYQMKIALSSWSKLWISPLYQPGFQLVPSKYFSFHKTSTISPTEKCSLLSISTRSQSFAGSFLFLSECYNVFTFRFTRCCFDFAFFVMLFADFLFKFIHSLLCHFFFLGDNDLYSIKNVFNIPFLCVFNLNRWNCWWLNVFEARSSCSDGIFFPMSKSSHNEQCTQWEENRPWSDKTLFLIVCTRSTKFLLLKYSANDLRVTLPRSGK